MLILCEPPVRSSAHSVSCRFACAFEKAGIRCRFVKTGWENPLSFLLRRRIPKALPLYYATLGTVLEWRAVRISQPGDIVWSYTNATSLNPFAPLGFARRTKQQGARYVFVLIDGWFQTAAFRDVTDALVTASDLTAAVTPRLVDDVRERFPTAPVALFEEPIDTDMVRPGGHAKSPDSLPRIVWTGGESNLAEMLSSCQDRLAEVYRRTPFTLRIVGAGRASVPSQPFPVERMPFHAETEGTQLSVGSVALNWGADTSYAERKGFYKIKTYLAAGVPVITNPVGYAASLVDNGTSGYIVHSGTELVDRLCGLLADPSRSSQLGENARRSALDRFSYGVQARRYIETLAEIFPKEIEMAARELTL